jgi:cysteine desulfurase
MKTNTKKDKKQNKKRIFLDYASVTPVAPEVLKVMEKTARENFANPSALYEEGREAKEILKISRQKIAESIGCRSQEIVFTSGGTESDNMAILGVFQSAKNSGILAPHIVTTKIEHPAVLEACHEVERRGGEVTYLPVSEDGLVSVKNLESAMKENTILVSVMFANNEIGTIQPIAEIGKTIKKWREKNQTGFPYFHSDACQAILYQKINMQKMGLDFLTIDGIKMYGPRGIGLLCHRLGLQISPIVFGGGQEGGLRSGTENLPAIVGLSKSFEIAEEMRESESARLSKIRDEAIKKILHNFPQAKINGSLEKRLPNNINICFPETDSEFLVVALDVEGVALSYSSTCRTLKEDSSSYVIEALEQKERRSAPAMSARGSCASSSLRITLGRDTKGKDIDMLVKALNRVINLV